MFNECKRNVVLSDMDYLGEAMLFVIVWGQRDVIMISERCDEWCDKLSGLWFSLLNYMGYDVDWS